MARLTVAAALLLAAGYSGLFAQSPNPSDRLLGRWDLVVQRGTQSSPSWLEVERSGTATLVGQFVGSGGSARPIAKIEFIDGAFRFAFTYVIPIGFVAFYPSQLFLRPEDVSPLIYFSPLIGIGLFAIMYWIWTLGVNSYTGTGS